MRVLPRRTYLSLLGRTLRVVVLLTFVRPALAEPSDADRALATELFQQGRVLMSEAKYAEACDKLAESQRLDPGGGTLLNLAVCHEQQGKTATAWSEFQEALALAERAAFKERIQIAREHIVALEPKLSRLTVLVSARSDLPQLVVRRDDSIVSRTAWGTAMPVDPGDHRIEASAPGRESWSTVVEVGPDGVQQEVAIPPLSEAPRKGAKPSSTATRNRVSLPVKRGPTRDSKFYDGATRRVFGFVGGGIGVIGLGVGTYFGLNAVSKDSESDRLCAGGCTPRANELSEQATTAADIATVSIVTGVVALGVGAYLILSGD
jgi:hypothetical protein